MRNNDVKLDNSHGKTRYLQVVYYASEYTLQLASIQGKALSLCKDKSEIKDQIYDRADVIFDINESAIYVPLNIRLKD